MTTMGTSASTPTEEVKTAAPTTTTTTAGGGAGAGAAPVAAAAAGGAGAAAAATSKSKTSETATFAAGCFWSVELIYQRQVGVTETSVGYTNGQVLNPTYEQVCTGRTGHAEAVQVIFDPSVITYTQLLDIFWAKHNPTTPNRQGNDRGTQYRSGIYYHSAEQKATAEASLNKHQDTLSAPIVTEVAEAGTWYRAEEYHQKYLEKGGQCSSKGNKDAIRCYG